MPQNNLCFECMPVDPVHQWSTRTWCSIVGDHASTPSRPIQVYFKLIWIFSFLLTPRRIHLKKTSRSVEIEHVTEYAVFRRLHLWALRGHALQIILLLNLFFLLGGKCSRSSTTGWLVGFTTSSFSWKGSTGTTSYLMSHKAFEIMPRERGGGGECSFGNARWIIISYPIQWKSNHALLALKREREREVDVHVSL